MIARKPTKIREDNLNVLIFFFASIRKPCHYTDVCQYAFIPALLKDKKVVRQVKDNEIKYVF